MSMAAPEKCRADFAKAFTETHDAVSGYPPQLRQEEFAIDSDAAYAGNASLAQAILQGAAEEQQGTPRAGSWSKRAASEPRLQAFGPSLGIRNRLEHARTAAAQAHQGSQQAGDLMEARNSLQESLRILERKLKAERQSAVSSTAKVRPFEHTNECATPKNSKALPHRVKAKSIDVDCDLMLLRRELQETMQLKDTALREVKALQRETGQLNSRLKAKDACHQEEVDALRQAMEAERVVAAEQRQENESLSHRVATLTTELSTQHEALRAAQRASEDHERRAEEAHQECKSLVRVEEELRERCQTFVEKEQQLEAQKQEATRLLEAQQAAHAEGILELQTIREQLVQALGAREQAAADLQAVERRVQEAREQAVADLQAAERRVQEEREQAVADRQAAERRVQEEREQAAAGLRAAEKRVQEERAQAAAGRLGIEQRLQEEQAAHQERQMQLTAAVKAAEELAGEWQAECVKLQVRLAESLEETQQLVSKHEEQLQNAMAERDVGLEACEKLRLQLQEHAQAFVQLRQQTADLAEQLGTQQNNTAQEQRNRLSAELSVLASTSEAEQWMEKCKQEQSLREETEQRLESAEKKILEQAHLHARVRSREALQRQALRRIEAQLHKPVWELSIDEEFADASAEAAGESAEEVEELAWLRDLQHMVKALSRRANRFDDVLMEGSRLKEQLVDLQTARCDDAQQLQTLKGIIDAERAFAYKAWEIGQETGKHSTSELDAARAEISRLQGLLKEANAAKEKLAQLEGGSANNMSQFELDLLQKLVAKQAEELYEARQELSQFQPETQRSQPQGQQPQSIDHLCRQVEATAPTARPAVVEDLSSMTLPATSHRQSLDPGGTSQATIAKVAIEAGNADAELPRPVPPLPIARIAAEPVDHIDNARLPQATPLSSLQLLEAAGSASRLSPQSAAAIHDAAGEAATQQSDEATELDSTAPTQVMVDEAMQQIRHAVLACFPDVASPAGSSCSVRRATDEDTSVRTCVMEAPQISACRARCAGNERSESPGPHSDSIEVHSVRSRVGLEPRELQAVMDSMSSLQNKLLGRHTQAKQQARRASESANAAGGSTGEGSTYH